MKYRADIDGLRAIAVLSVFAFHANINLLGGGYVGVDIFFVISGYLISEIIFGQIDSGGFSLSRFYLRRVRRIVPALCVMTICVLFFAWKFFYPSELVEVSESAVASALSVSNIFFWSSVGYFDAPSNSKPLLHTWSLGVEEQFYIFFPLLVSWIGVNRNFRVAALAVLAAGSLGVSQYLALMDQSSAFYLPYSRFWELLVGSLLAAGAVKAPTNRIVREGVALLALVAILVAVLTYGHLTTFPGFSALVPCLGTAAIIACGFSERTVVSRILALRPVVFVGLISYSLYLWHWPMIVFERVGQIVRTGLSPTVDKVLVVGLTFAVATLSWRFVEVPFRRDIRSWLEGRSVTPLVGSSLICAIGVAVALTAGFPARFSPESTRLASYLDYNGGSDMRGGRCFLLDQQEFRSFDANQCLSRRPARKSILLIGDSHAGHLYQGLNFVYGKDVDILQATATGCKPLLRDMNGDTTCAKMANFVYGTYLAQNQPDLLLISARWSADDVDGIATTMQWLKDRHVPAVLIGPTPEFDLRLPRLLAQAKDLQDKAAIQNHVVRGIDQLDRLIGRSVGGTLGTRYLSAYEALCPRGVCDVFAGDSPIYYDTGHFTKAGSMMFVKRLGPLIQE